MSFLRKQEARPHCACSGVAAGAAGTGRYFLDSRLRWKDTLGWARQGRGRLLHSTNLTVSTGNYDHNLWGSTRFLTGAWGPG